MLDYRPRAVSVNDKTVIRQDDPESQIPVVTIRQLRHFLHWCVDQGGTCAPRECDLDDLDRISCLPVHIRSRIYDFCDAKDVPIHLLLRQPVWRPSLKSFGLDLIFFDEDAEERMIQHRCALLFPIILPNTHLQSSGTISVVIASSPTRDNDVTT